MLLDDVALPLFLRPYQVIRAVDRDCEVVAARIAPAVGKGTTTSAPAPYPGQRFVFTVAAIDDSGQLVVTSADGVRRTVMPAWRRAMPSAWH